ncbi:hypothetical protein MIT9_P1376 [Methylomarinovum caldicuralii]|uniref:Uncharacterized protein n=1 Tax=Methylomarinovum caldicuralii TaxID=438856 RepID=A0AAU9CJK2_9GAMM|nr:hypothetical protein [Methylomarinovum caldicuralii]BCX81796.1 hypothetical protein MIT9_P1376 [Methylomarinovum caldicuralii]
MPVSDEEKREILESPPKGTWALMLIVAAGMAVAWVFLYFGVFIPRGFVQ